MNEEAPVWHLETVDGSVQRTLKDLRQLPIARSFYLAGGTGLALHLGHRRSVDLDFFLAGDFEEDFLLQKMQRLEGFALVEKKPGTIYAHIRGTKVSFIAYTYPVLFPFQLFLGALSSGGDLEAVKAICAEPPASTKSRFGGAHYWPRLTG